MSIIAFKCPSCGSGMKFNAEKGTLGCESCGRQDAVEQIQDPLAASALSEQGDSGGAREYHCNSCGAVIETTELTSATSCSFCGSSAVLADRLSGTLHPAQIIPFGLSKDQALDVYRKWRRRSRLSPGGFARTNRMKSITGMYVPFWLYDLNNHVQVQAKGTKVRTSTVGDYVRTDTDHYDIYRELDLSYVKVPVDSSEKLNDDEMDQLEPFGYDRLQSFRSPYLAGFSAERYEYNEEELFPRVKDKIYSHTKSVVDSTVREYRSVSYSHIGVEADMEKAAFVLLPVWIIQYEFKRENHQCIINGQTGKVATTLPISKGRAFSWFSGISVALLIVMQLLTIWYLGGVY